MRSLDAHIVEVEQVLVRLLHGDAQHHLGGQFDEVNLQHLAHEGEGAGGAEVALDDLDVVVTGQELDVERTGDVQLAGYLTADALDAAHGLHVEFLRGKLDSGVTAVYAGKLDVLADGVGNDFSLFCHGIHLHFLGVLDELAHHHGVLLADVGGQLEEAFQFLLVGADVHRRATQHIRGTHQDGEAYLRYKGVDVVHRGQRAPFGLVHTDAVEHGGELVAVFGIVDALGAGAEDGHTLGIEAHSQVIGDLSARRDDDAVRILQFEDVHHTLEGQLVEVEAVAHIIVCGDGFRVVVYHHAAVALLADGVQCLHTAPVELYGRADAVGTTAQHHDTLVVAQVVHVVFRAAVRQVEVVGLRGIFGGEGVYLLHHGQDAAALAVAAYLQGGLLDVLVLLHTDGAGYLEVGEALSFRLI